jgi:hypothetical protein
MNEEDFLTEEQKQEIQRWEGVYTSLNTINECLVAVGNRLEAIEKFVSELPTPDKVFYKPKGYDDYLNMKQNYDELYGRIIKLEERIDGLQN